MYVFLNNEKTNITQGQSLASFLAAHTQTTAFAIAINDCFVPKTKYAETQLQEGDRIELVTPMQGG